MATSLKFKVDFDGEKTRSLLNFITEVQEGKYTSEKPNITEIAYRRLEIQDFENINQGDENPEEVILYGVSY